MKNSYEITSKTYYFFICNSANDDNWDMFSSTGGYSPRNEAYLYATQLVDMWRQLATGHPDPHGKHILIACYCLVVQQKRETILNFMYL